MFKVRRVNATSFETCMKVTLLSQVHEVSLDDEEEEKHVFSKRLRGKNVEVVYERSLISISQLEGCI